MKYRDHTCGQCEHFDPPVEQRVVVAGGRPASRNGRCRHHIIGTTVPNQPPGVLAIHFTFVERLPTTESCSAFTPRIELVEGKPH